VISCTDLDGTNISVFITEVRLCVFYVGITEGQFACIMYDVYVLNELLIGIGLIHY